MPFVGDETGNVYEVTKVVFRRLLVLKYHQVLCSPVHGARNAPITIQARYGDRWLPLDEVWEKFCAEQGLDPAAVDAQLAGADPKC
jgi:hypothetical protein